MRLMWFGGAHCRVEWERGFNCTHWVRTALGVACMVGAGAAAWVAAQLFTSPVVRVLCAGAALLVCYVAVKYVLLSVSVSFYSTRCASERVRTF